MPPSTIFRKAVKLSHRRFSCASAQLHWEDAATQPLRRVAEPLSLPLQHSAFRRTAVPVRESAWRRVCQWYAEKSTERPYLAAFLTGGAMCSGADVFAQCLTTKDEKGRFKWDIRRTLSMMAFGSVWYGGPVKALYLGYARFIGEGTIRAALTTAATDCSLHTPFLLLPAFYFSTGLLQGMSINQVKDKMQTEWFAASTTMVGFWLPVCTANFFFVPQHSRILFVGCFNFLNKTWLSWHSNKLRRTS